MRKTILVTGKSGQLGQSLKKIAGQYPLLDFSFVGRDELNLAVNKSIADFFADKKYDFIINCAAYTAVDKAESEPELADQINHLAVKQLAEIAKKQNSVLIHISTDYVFDGKNHKPYTETDQTNPINVYGLSKLKGEQAIQTINPKSVIIRTSWVYSEFGNNFVQTMLRLAKERDSLNVVYDQVGSPTYATDLAKVCLILINSKRLDHFESGKELLAEEDQPCHPNEIQSSTVKQQSCSIIPQKSSVEIYHYSNEGVCSWYDFAKAIFEIKNINCQLTPIQTKHYPTPAKRPYFSLMGKEKIKREFSIPSLYWKDSLKKSIT